MHIKTRLNVIINYLVKKKQSIIMKSSDEPKKIPIYSVKTGKIELQDKVIKTDEEWKKILTPNEFNVARKQGTELAFTGKYHDCHEDGIYKCVCCEIDLFDSKTKFESGTAGQVFGNQLQKKM